MSIDFLITNAGLAALAALIGSDTVTIDEVGLTDQSFLMAGSLTALPGEVAHLNLVSGTPIDELSVHLTARDTSTDAYAVRGIGLYLDDGTLFACYSQADPIFEKSALSTFLLALDIAFASGTVENITFGDANFINPPASETVAGIAEIATEAEVTAGTDPGRIVTPLRLQGKLAAYILLSQKGAANGVASLGPDGKVPTAQLPPVTVANTFVVASEAAMLALSTADTGDLAVRTDNGKTFVLKQTPPATLANWIELLFAVPVQSVNGQVGDVVLSPGDVGAVPTARQVLVGGIATGGGALTADRTITVPEADAAALRAGVAHSAATPAALAALDKNLAQKGRLELPLGVIFHWGRFTAAANGTTTVTFDGDGFPNACWSVVVSGGGDMGINAKDNLPAVIGSSITKESFQVGSADDGANLCCYLAIGN